MKNKFQYSVAIRTLGTAGAKYKKLIDSIANQTIQPEKVIVVLPEGYSIPNYKIGIETFVFSKKGMIEQRIFALGFISSDYILFCDDDVEFPSNFMEKISDAFVSGEFSCAAGPLLSFFPPKKIKHYIASLLGGASIMLHGRKNTYVRVLSTGGWSYNRSIDTKHHKFYYTDSLAWTCFCVSKQAMDAIHFEDELWAGKNGYAAFDDQLFFSKLKLNGFKTCVVSDAEYIHNDGKTSIQGLKLEPIYATAFNHYVFWYRCLYSICNNPFRKTWLRICIQYSITTGMIYSRMKHPKSERKIVLSTKKKGFSDAKKFVKSNEYKSIPNIVRVERTSREK